MFGGFTQRKIEASYLCFLTTYMFILSVDCGQAHIETHMTQPTQGREAQVSVIHTFEYVSAS
jgi:hypothetical protein